MKIVDLDPGFNRGDTDGYETGNALGQPGATESN